MNINELILLKINNMIDLYCYEQLPPYEYFEKINKNVTINDLKNHLYQFLNNCTSEEVNEIILIEKQRKMKNIYSSKKKILQKR